MKYHHRRQLVSIELLAADGMQDKIKKKQYNQLLEELELHYERGMMFSHQRTLAEIQVMQRKYPFLTS